MPFTHTDQDRAFELIPNGLKSAGQCGKRRKPPLTPLCTRSPAPLRKARGGKPIDPERFSGIPTSRLAALADTECPPPWSFGE